MIKELNLSPNYSDITMIKGKTIILRNVKKEDLEKYYDLLVDVQNKGEYYPQELLSYAVFQRKFHKTGFWHKRHGALLIVDTEDCILGEITFRDLAHRKAFDIGYIVFDFNSRSKGVMTEALHLFSNFLFKTNYVQRLELAIIPGNDSSKKVAKKYGFSFEGISRNAYYVEGKYVDLENYSLLKEECIKN